MKNLAQIFIGIDFSKEKFDAAYLDRDGVMNHAVFKNVKKDYAKLLRWVKQTGAVKGRLDPEQILFCGEHTGECSIQLSEWLVSKGYRVWLENAVRIKRHAGIVRGKNDKADAKMIARYALERYNPSESRLFVPDTDDVKKLRSLCACRNSIVRQRVALGNRIGSGCFKNSPEMLAGLRALHASMSKKEKELEKYIENFMEASAELCDNYRILVSFKGIGALTAAVLLVCTSNFTRFDDPRKFACQCGLAPFSQESGKSVKTKPHVSHYANLKAKAALSPGALSAMIHNPVIRAYAERLLQKGKAKGVVINNVKNKMIHILFKMIADRQPWQADYQERHMSGNLSQRSLGVTEEKGAAEATPCAAMSVQPSPSVFGGTAKLRKTPKNGKLSKKTSPKICTET